MLGEAFKDPTHYNLMVINPVGTAARTKAKVIIIMSLIMTGLSLCEPLGVGGVGVPVDDAADEGGLILDTFLNIAASGELADSPKSSVTVTRFILITIKKNSHTKPKTIKFRIQTLEIMFNLKLKK